MGVRVTRSLVLCECFVYRCLSCCPFSLRHCLVCSSTIYGFWLPLWYLQTLLMYILYLNFGFYFLNRIPLTLGCLWNISYLYISIIALFLIDIYSNLICSDTMTRDVRPSSEYECRKGNMLYPIRATHKLWINNL